METTSQTLVGNPDETEFPKTWRFDSDGLDVEGTYIRLDEAPSQYGSQAIVVLLVAGEERSVWLNTMALRNQFADELRRRGDRDFTLGERIHISRGAEKKEAASGHHYWPVRVRFLDAPSRDAASLLGIELDNVEPVQDDDVPF